MPLIARRATHHSRKGQLLLLRRRLETALGRVPYAP